MTNIVEPKKFIIENLGYRIGLYYPKCNIQIGTGVPDADIVVVQPHTKMPERDAITGALKNFGMLNDAYRATSSIITFPDTSTLLVNETLRAKRQEKLATPEDINRYYLRELIEIIRPLIVVACGPEVTQLLRQKTMRSFKIYCGKKFRVEDLTGVTFCATINPAEYGFARAPKHLKEQGKTEWTKIAEIYQQLKEKKEKERWG